MYFSFDGENAAEFRGVDVLWFEYALTERLMRGTKPGVIQKWCHYLICQQQKCLTLFNYAEYCENLLNSAPETSPMASLYFNTSSLKTLENSCFKAVLVD